MVGRRALSSFLLLGALMLCVVAAQRAAAEKLSFDTTAYTCVFGGGETNEDFKDEHCDEKVAAGTGTFEHAAIAGATKTTIAATNQRVTELTIRSEPAVFKGTIGLAKVTITCQKVEATTKETYIENVEPEAKVHTVSGTAVLDFSGCAVSQLEKCEVKEPIESRSNVVGVEGLVGPKGEATESNAMGLRFTGEGVPGTAFASIRFTGKECSLKEQEFQITGSLIATSGPTTESAQNNEWGGATLAFTPKFKMESLKLGSNTAEFSTIITPRMAGTGGNPISTTTPT